MTALYNMYDCTSEWQSPNLNLLTQLILNTYDNGNDFQ